MTGPILAIFLRYPVPGEVKTRLIPALGAEGAARCYRKLVDHTLAAARASGLEVELRVTGAAPEDFRRWLGDEFPVWEQGDGGLGERMARVATPAVLIGSDAPGLDAARLKRAAEALSESDIVIGPANDGGYYLIGLVRPMPFLFTDMPWSTADVLPETLRRLARRRIAPTLLPPLDDIDEPADLAAWPELAE